MDLTAVIDKLQKLTQKKSTSKGLLCVQFNMEGIAAAYRPYSAKPEDIVLCEFLPCNTPELRTSVLLEFVEQNNLQNEDCCYILHPNEYRLLLLDKPKVPKTEMASAARWLVKDLLDQPVEETTIDCFETPKSPNQPEKIYTASCQTSSLHELITIIEDANLKPKNISITELALIQLIAKLPESYRGIGLLFLDEAQTFIVIAQNDTLYFTRHMPTKLTAENPEQLTSEIQNSISYYCLQMGQPTITQLCIAPAQEISNELTETLSAQLRIPTSIIDLNKSFNFKDNLTSETQAQCATVLGGLLYAGGDK